jgi:hypothetical protein
MPKLNFTPPASAIRWTPGNTRTLSSGHPEMQCLTLSLTRPNEANKRHRSVTCFPEFPDRTLHNCFQMIDLQHSPRPRGVASQMHYKAGWRQRASVPLTFNLSGGNK